MRNWLALLVVTISATPAVGAQTRTTENMTTVRAELAAVLLQSKKYDDAAREYRALLARDGSNFDYRLGLARALAWGDRPREAEGELRTLQSKRIQSATIDTLLRVVRDALEPRASEAAAWVSERRDYAPYRLAFARALAKEHYYWAAAAQYDTLLTVVAVGTIPEPLVLQREQARAMLDGGDVVGGVARVRDILRLTPTDSALRHELAVSLTDNRRDVEARAQYDTLLAKTPTAPLFVERARLRLAAGDRRGAEYDLLASLDLGPTVQAYLTLGMLNRDRGDYTTAREMYRGALAKVRSQHGNLAEVRADLAQLAREERPVAAFAPAIGDDPGWRVSTDGVSDNLGVHYASSTLSRAIPLGDATRLAVAVLHQYLGERSPERTIDLNAYGGEASLASELAYGPFLGRIGLSGGMLRPPASRNIPLGSATAAAWINAWELAFERSTGAAYPSLLTTAAIRPLAGNAENRDANTDVIVNDVLTEQSTDAMFGGPLGAADVALSAQQSSLSDGNRRVTLQGYLRYPLAPAVFVVYVANRVTYAERSTRYWDPIDFVAQSAGFEVGARDVRGLSWAVRALPGMAWSRELFRPTTSDSRTARRERQVVSQSAFQLATSGEIVWRDPRWEGTAAASYGLGRVSEYRRLGLTLGLRILR